MTLQPVSERDQQKARRQGQLHSSIPEFGPVDIQRLLTTTIAIIQPFTPINMQVSTFPSGLTFIPTHTPPPALTCTSGAGNQTVNPLIEGRPTLPAR